MNGMEMGGSASCKLSMLWNWYTVDACFITSQWHVSSPGMFVGTCIGVICLVVSLAFVRRLHREYERYIASQWKYQRLPSRDHVVNGLPETDSVREGVTLSKESLARQSHGSSVRPWGTLSFRPSLLQQSVRATLHTVQFGIAYFIMLLVMYFNGYIIICVLLGAFIGYGIFDWEIVPLGSDTTTEITGCCG